MRGPEELSDHEQAVRRMESYIEEHLTEPITQKQLAAAAGYSPFHSARLFKEHTGQAPFEYIRKRRLARGADRLRDGGVRIVDVALEFVFGSHEGFTRAFYREFGVTPRDYARRPGAVWRGAVRGPFGVVYGPYGAAAGPAEKTHVENRERMKNTMAQPAIFVQIMERPARRMILKRGKKAAHYFEYCEEVGCDVWDWLCGVKEALYEPIGVWLPDGMRPVGTSVYCQGVEVPADYAGALPEGYELVDLPACKMMIFQGTPYDDEEYMTAVGDLMEQIERYDPRIYGYEWAPEEAPRFQLAPMGYRGYIEGRPVRPAGA